jgi:hypothetical protein
MSFPNLLKNGVNIKFIRFFSFEFLIKNITENCSLKLIKNLVKPAVVFMYESWPSFSIVQLSEMVSISRNITTSAMVSIKYGFSS